MREHADAVLHSMLPEDRGRWRSFAAGFSVELVAIALLATITVTAPRMVEQHYTRIDLVAPDLSPAKIERPRPVIIPPAKAQLEQMAPPKTVAPQPKLEQPQIAEVKPTVAAVKPVPVAAPKFESAIVDKPAGPKVRDSIKTDLFAGSSAKPTLVKPAHEVQTGGFGDPNGVPANDHGSNKPNIASVGAFDLPQGGGQGNGSGGTKGAKGTVASAGFGNGIATEGGGGGRGSAGQGKVQLTSFGGGTAETPQHTVARAEQPATKPVAIESKPQPVYTSEAKQLRIEGEVLVKVIFTASGKVQVVNVVRGLGHGLDEAAVRAAEGIQFKPAQRMGQAVDSNATLHIVFQLS